VISEDTVGEPEPRRATGIVAVPPDALVDERRAVRCVGRRTARRVGDRGVESMGAEIAETDDDLELHDLWRVWVTPSDRKRCTYVTRDEQPLAAAGGRANADIRI
jgi:hypothetical protein